MKKYIGTKTIQAEPMTKFEAQKRLGREIKSQHSDADHDEEGYLVQYEDGYLSWSPKLVFCRAYRLADTPLDRMTIEISELNQKLYKLSAFMLTDKFNALDKDIRDAMHDQLAYMKAYSQVLEHRFTLMNK